MNRTAFAQPTPLLVSRCRLAITPHASRPEHTRARRAPLRASLITPEAARVCVAAYGLLISGGGVAAYLNTGSKPSAISGVISGVILAVAYAKNNIPIALATAVLLTIVFGVRVVKTKKLVPSGVLLAISVVAAALFAAALA